MNQLIPNILGFWVAKPPKALQWPINLNQQGGRTLFMLVQTDDIRYPIIGVTTQLKSSSNLTSVHSDCKKNSWIPSWTKNIEIVLSSWKALESTSWCLHQPFCGHMFRIPQHIRPSYDGMYPPSILVTDDSGKCDCHSQWIFESTWKIWPQVLTHKSALTGGI